MSRACCMPFLIAALLMLPGGTSRGEEAHTDLHGDPLPPGAVARLGTIRLRHLDADLAFSRDGKHLISLGGDGEVRVWDAATGRLARRTRLAWKTRKNELSRGTVLAPDAALAAVWDDSGVHLYDTATGKEGVRLPARNERVCSLALAPDGKRLAALKPNGKAGGGAVMFWSTDALEKEPIRLHDSSIGLLQVAFAPHGKRLVGINGVSPRIFWWDVTAAGEVGEEHEHTTSWMPWSLAYSPDGKMLAVGSRAEGWVHLLDAATLKETAARKPPAAIRSAHLGRLAFSPDGRWLAGGFDEDADVPSGKLALAIWNLTGREKTRCLPAYHCNRFAFAPDGKTLACHDDSGGGLRLWDVASVRLLHSWPGHARPVQALSASPDGKVIASGDASGMLCLWDTAFARQLQTFTAHGGISSCLFSPDGKRLISTDRAGTYNGRITYQVWDFLNGKKLRRIDGGLWVHDYATGISADGKRLLVAGSSKTGDTEARLFVWDLDTGKRLSDRPYKIQAKQFEGESTTHWRAHAAFTPDGERVSSWQDGRVGIEEVATGRLLAELPAGVGRRLVFSPDGRLVAAAVLPSNRDAEIDGEYKGLSLIEAATGEEIARLEMEQFQHVVFTPDSRSVIGIDKKRLRVWDTATGERLHQMEWPESIRDARGETDICSAAALPGGRIATGMVDGDILIWDLAPLKWPTHKPQGDLDEKEFAALWSELAAEARKAYRAIAILADRPAHTLPFLKEHLRPTTVDAKRIEQLLADLDGDSFTVREAASHELIRWRYQAEPMLRRALEGKPALEMRRRLQAILAGPNRPRGEDVRTLRGIAVLERIGSPEARRTLEKFAGGAMGPETREAKAALQRLNRR